jgi:hypothetical protein
MELDQYKAAAFEAQYQALTAPGHNPDEYTCPYPKHEFLRYICQHKAILLHGSNHPAITTLEPRQQSDWKGRPLQAVFASSDGIWPMFFATVDYAIYRGGLRNGCFVTAAGTHQERRYYFFSLDESYQHQPPWRAGTIYLLPRESFRPTAQGLVRFDEWASPRPIQPLARISITPQDFPFLNNVTWHPKNESIYRTWLRFKRRQRR